jgi:hypothetical protein
LSVARKAYVGWSVAKATNITTICRGNIGGGLARLSARARIA